MSGRDWHGCHVWPFTIAGGGGMKTLLLALLVGLAAIAASTLSAAAQPGGDGANDADPQGRIIARIQDRTGDDGVDDYRIEFGFFPEWAMDDKDPWSEAVATWSDWLPRSRFLTKTVIDRRAAADNRRWLRSSLISVPASAQRSGGGAQLEDDGASGQSLIEGRVIARYHPDSRGRLRVEFGFLPEWAFIRTSNTEEAVEQYGGDLLPRARYISASMIENRRGVWLRSSVVELTSAPVLVIEQAPAIDSISCSPSQPDVDEAVTCTAALSGGAPNSWAWSGGDSGGDSAAYNTTFSSSGAKIVSLTVRNSAGSDSDSTTLTVEETAQAPTIDSVSCSPSSPTVDEAVTCTAALSGGAPNSWAWSGGDSGGDTSTYNTTFSSAGAKTVSLTVRNSAGSDSESTTLTVSDELQAPVIDSISCPSSAAVGERVACTASNSGGAIDAYAWSDSDGGSGDSSSYSTSFNTSGAKTVSLTARNAAGSDSDSTGVTVTGVPQINLNCPSAADVDERITCTVSNSGDTIDSYAWRDSDGGSGSSASYSTSFSSAGAKTIRVTARNSAGSDSDSASVRVAGAPVISVSCPSSAAVDQSVACTVSNSGGAIDSYAWSDSDGGSGSSSSYSTSFSSSGAKTVSLTASNAAGSDSDSTSVEVRAPPEINISCPSSADVGQSVACTVSNSGGAIDSYAWSDSDGGSGSSSSYSASFSSSGAKTIRLTARNAAGSDSDAASLSVQLSPPRIDSISCSSSRPDVDEIITCTVSASGGAIDSYTWSGGSGSNSHGGRRGATYRVSFVFDATERIRLTVRNAAGSDSETIWIEVQPVRPYIVISCPSSAGVDESVTCTVRNSGAAIDSYSWSDSDGGSGSSASYSTSFSSLGAKTVSATASNSVGSHNARATINVLPELPQISISCPSSVVLNESFTCTVSNSGGAIDRYVWSDSVGGAGSDSSYSTSFRYTGQRTVLLYAHNAAGHDSDSVIVEVRAPPQPEVQLPDVSISCPSSAAVYQPNVACTVSNSGGAIDSYAWSDSDGGSGSSSSYSTSFTTAGAKTISLTARNSAGSDNASATVEVREPPQISVSCPSSAVVNESITCTVSNSGGPIDTYAWSDNGGGSGSGSSYSTSFSTTGVKTVLLYVRSSAGSDNGSAGVEVRAAAPPVQLPDVSVSCPSSAAVNQRVACTVSNSGGAIDSYAWSDSGGGSGSGSSYSTRFNTSGAKTVSLTATNSAGSDSASAGVNVIALPVITVSCPSTADTGETITCTVSNSGGAIVRYIWVASDGGSGSGSSYSTSFSSAGAKGIRLTARNAAGAASDSTTVEVRAASP